MLSETTKLRIYSGYKTNTGTVCERNEDVFVQRKVPLGYFAAIADGSSAHENGDQAAAYTLVSVLNEVAKANSDPEKALLRGFQAANKYLRDQSAANGSNLSASCVAALISKGKLYVGHTGDARAYMLRGANLYTLTRDHSIIQQPADIKEQNTAETAAASSPTPGSCSIGAEEQIYPEIRPPIPLAAGDAIMLCSDGLNNIVTEKLIRRVLAGATPREAAARLVEIASEKGAHDNTTIIVLRLDADPHPQYASTMSLDQLKTMHIQTPEGRQFPIIDVTLNPTTWAIVGLRLDLSSLKQGATCEIPVSEVGPMASDGNAIITLHCAEFLSNLAQSSGS